MALNSFNFIIFLIILFIILFILQYFKMFFDNKNNQYAKLITRGQIMLLLIFSYIFMCFTDIRFGICMFIITLISYIIGILIDKNFEHKKMWLILGILFSLLMLAYFKYANFFINSIRAILKMDSIYFNIILPIGISFYTFTVISYLVDIYRKKINAETNFINFALLISFFPKVMAGPIIRSSEFLPQIKKYTGLNIKNFEIGIQIFVFGLFKKIVLADHLCVFVDDVFFAPTAYNTMTVILAVISYSVQIYCDFSGYSDMAIGISKMLGFNFPHNFNLPYLATNISNFWKRWHISLSSWLQDYIYIPLGGSRKGTLKTFINLLIVMLLSGLWHGAGLTFIIWGFMYGLLSCISKLFKKSTNNKFIISTKVLFTFIIVTLLWVWFRATSVSNALDVYKQMFTVNDGISQMYTWSFFAILCLVVATIAAMLKSNKTNRTQIDGFYPILNLSKFSSLVIFFTFIGITIMLGYFGNNAFIYGKF